VPTFSFFIRSSIEKKKVSCWPEMGCLKLTYYENETPLKVVQGNFLSEEKSGAGAYRYGFNGKEKDSKGEWGSSTHYDYGFRIYKPGIGRFLSVDPLTKDYPWYTPYQFAGNKPIRFIDLDGLEEFDPMTGENADMKAGGFMNSVTNTFLRSLPELEFYLRKKAFAKIGVTDAATIEKFQLRMRLVAVGDPYYTLDEITHQLHEVQDYERVPVLEPKQSFLKESLETLIDGTVVLSAVTGLKGGSAGSTPGVFFAKGGNYFLAKNIQAIYSKVSEIAKRNSQIFKCMECADEIVSTLKSQGISGQIVDVTTESSKGMRGNIWSDKAGDLISTNGKHRGVLVEGKVFDNVHTEGIDYDTWLKDFHTPSGELKVTKTDF
jgi:RHS repeat-associated protein